MRRLAHLGPAPTKESPSADGTTSQPQRTSLLRDKIAALGGSMLRREGGSSSQRADMPRKSESKTLLVGLDIGTSKIVAIVGEYAPGEPVEVIGLGSHPSKGMKRGVVVDIESTVQSIRRAIEEAELMAGCEIRSVFAGISGSHVRSLNSQGVVAIRDKEVTEGDVERVLDAARAVAIPADQRILHVLPQEYVIDEQEGIRHPIGMSGVRLRRACTLSRAR